MQPPIHRTPAVLAVAVVLAATAPAQAVVAAQGDVAHGHSQSTATYEDGGDGSGADPGEASSLSDDQVFDDPDHEMAGTTGGRADSENASHDDAGGGHDQDAEAPAPRPRVAVLSGFAAVNASVLAAAALLRRRDRGRPRHRPRPAAVPASTSA